jgi:hypothetical protein
MSIFSPANVSSAAMLFVGIHVVANFVVGVGLTYIATAIFGLSFVSGLFGFFFTRTPNRRRHWLWFHRRLTVLFYATILFHVVTKGAFGLTVIGLLAFAWILWRRRKPLALLLARWSWPFRRRQPPRSPGIRNGRNETVQSNDKTEPSTATLRSPRRTHRRTLRDAAVRSHHDEWSV